MICWNKKKPDVNFTCMPYYVNSLDILVVASTYCRYWSTIRSPLLLLSWPRHPSMVVSALNRLVLGPFSVEHRSNWPSQQSMTAHHNTHTHQWGTVSMLRWGSLAMKSLVVLNGCTSCMFYGRAEFGADFLISKASSFVSFFFYLEP